MAKLVATGMIFSGSSSVLEMLNMPDIGLSKGELIEVDVTNPLMGKSRTIFATKSCVPALDTCKDYHE